MFATQYTTALLPKRRAKQSCRHQDMIKTGHCRYLGDERYTLQYVWTCLFHWLGRPGEFKSFRKQFDDFCSLSICCTNPMTDLLGWSRKFRVNCFNKYKICSILAVPTISLNVRGGYCSPAATGSSPLRRVEGSVWREEDGPCGGTDGPRGGA